MRFIPSAAKVGVFAVLISTIAIGPASTRAAEANGPERERIIAMTRELMDAIGLGKTDVWQRILADDAIIIDEFGRKQGKAEAVKALKPFPDGFAGSIEVRDAHVHLFGDTAVIDCEAFERESVFHQQLTVRYIFTITYVRIGGVWKMAAMQDTTLPTEPPALTVEGLRLEDYPGIYRYGPGRAYTFGITAGGLAFTTKNGGKPTTVRAIARDVFMDDGDEKNLLIFRRDAKGDVQELIERRKFNDLHLTRGHDTH